MSDKKSILISLIPLHIRSSLVRVTLSLQNSHPWTMDLVTFLNSLSVLSSTGGVPRILFQTGIAEQEYPPYVQSQMERFCPHDSYYVWNGGKAQGLEKWHRRADDTTVIDFSEIFPRQEEVAETANRQEARTGEVENATRVKQAGWGASDTGSLRGSSLERPHEQVLSQQSIPPDACVYVYFENESCVKMFEAFPMRDFSDILSLWNELPVRLGLPSQQSRTPHRGDVCMFYFLYNFGGFAFGTDETFEKSTKSAFQSYFTEKNVTLLLVRHGGPRDGLDSTIGAHPKHPVVASVLQTMRKTRKPRHYLSWCCHALFDAAKDFVRRTDMGKSNYGLPGSLASASSTSISKRPHRHEILTRLDESRARVTVDRQLMQKKGVVLLQLVQDMFARSIFPLHLSAVDERGRILLRHCQTLNSGREVVAWTSENSPKARTLVLPRELVSGALFTDVGGLEHDLPIQKITRTGGEDETIGLTDQVITGPVGSTVQKQARAVAEWSGDHTLNKFGKGTALDRDKTKETNEWSWGSKQGSFAQVYQQSGPTAEESGSIVPDRARSIGKYSRFPIERARFSWWHSFETVKSLQDYWAESVFWFGASIAAVMFSSRDSWTFLPEDWVKVAQWPKEQVFRLNHENVIIDSDGGRSLAGEDEATVSEPRNKTVQSNKYPIERRTNLLLPRQTVTDFEVCQRYSGTLVCHRARHQIDRRDRTPIELKKSRGIIWLKTKPDKEKVSLWTRQNLTEAVAIRRRMGKDSLTSQYANVNAIARRARLESSVVFLEFETQCGRRPHKRAFNGTAFYGGEYFGKAGEAPAVHCRTRRKYG